MWDNNLKNKIRIFATFSFGLMIIYSLMFYIHFSSDTFAAIFSKKADMKGNFSLGRPGDYFLTALLRWLHIDYVKHQWLFVGILIISLSYFSYVMYFVLNKYIDVKWNVILLLSLLVLTGNVLILEWFIYIEMDFNWAAAIFFLTLSLKELDKNLRIKEILFAILFLSISLCFYQGTISWFITYGIIILYARKKSCFDFALNCLKCFFIAAICSVENILLIKIFVIAGVAKVTNRTGNIGLNSIVNNFCIATKEAFLWITTMHGLIPQNIWNFMLVVYLLLLIAFFIFMKKLSYIFVFLLIESIVFIASYFPQIVASDIYMPQRTVVTLPLLLIVIILYIAINDGDIHYFRYASMVIVIFMLLVNYICVQHIGVNVISNNKDNALIARMIQEDIHSYEEESGMKIKYIAIHSDDQLAYSYPEIQYVLFDTNIKAMNISWNAVRLINYYNGTCYEMKDFSDEEYEKYFGNDNWNCVNPKKQWIEIGDTLYIANY